MSNGEFILFIWDASIKLLDKIFVIFKLHFPKIRVKSADGFLSKFYQPVGDNTFAGIDVL